MNPDVSTALQQLGQLIDKADNYLAYRTAHVPPQLKVESFTYGLQEIRDDLKRLYFELGGADVWDMPAHAHPWQKGRNHATSRPAPGR